MHTQALNSEFIGTLCPMHPHAVIALENAQLGRRRWGPYAAWRNARNAGVHIVVWNAACALEDALVRAQAEAQAAYEAFLGMLQANRKGV